MLNHAASLWGVNNPHALDPFVKLLIDAFSTEIFKVNNEVSNIKTRMLHKLSHLLTPTLYTLPRPAHAIANAQPVEPYFILNPEQELFCKKNVSAGDEYDIADTEMNIAFTTVDYVQLVQGRLATIVTGNYCYSIDEHLFKVPVVRCTGNALPHGEMWLGIELNKEVHHLDELPLYFSGNGHEHHTWLYELLPYAAFYSGTQPLKVTPGMKYHTERQRGGYREIFNEYSTFKKITGHIKTIYQQHFITLSGFPEDACKQASHFPEALLPYFDAGTINSQFKKNAIWIHIKFPPNYTREILESFHISINAFPVFNRAKRHTESGFNVSGNIIPLSTAPGEHYLSVHEVIDNDGKVFSEIPYAHTSALQKGLYSIRVGGIERFDTRSASDLINYMLEQTRDEVAAFSTLNREYVTAALRAIAQQMQQLQNRNSHVNRLTKNIPTYLVVEPHTTKGSIYTAYWITHCDWANNIRSGTRLNIYGNTALQPGSILLQTTTYAGEEQTRGNDAIQAFRYALTSRDRLVTVEDIRAYCMLQLGDLTKEVIVKKGTAVSTKPKEGFIRTLDVTIVLINYNAHTPEHWQKRALALQEKIESLSVNGIHYRVFFV